MKAVTVLYCVAATGLAAFLSLALYFTVAAEYTVVTDGECFTFKSQYGWVRNECFSTKAEAERDMEDFKNFVYKEDKYESRDWKKAN